MIDRFWTISSMSAKTGSGRDLPVGGLVAPLIWENIPLALQYLAGILL
jgi:hypothetical protein